MKELMTLKVVGALLWLSVSMFYFGNDNAVAGTFFGLMALSAVA